MLTEERDWHVSFDGRVLENDWDAMQDNLQIRSDVELMMFTGLKDKNGVEIYEGDLIFAPLNSGRYLVRHGPYNDVRIDDHPENACFGWNLRRIIAGRPEEWGETLARSKSSLEVIGNIHENPELINGKS